MFQKLFVCMGDDAFMLNIPNPTLFSRSPSTGIIIMSFSTRNECRYWSCDLHLLPAHTDGSVLLGMSLIFHERTLQPQTQHIAS